MLDFKPSNGVAPHLLKVGESSIKNATPLHGVDGVRPLFILVWFAGFNLCAPVFYFLLRSGVVLVIFSKRVFRVWCGIEIRFFGLIPLLVGKSAKEAESRFKYFMVQVMGSSLILCCIVSILGDIYVGYFLMVFMVLGLFLKLGVFPFHSWFPRVIRGCSARGCFLLLTAQKVGPY